MTKSVKCLVMVFGLCIVLHRGYGFQLKSDVLSSGGTKMTAAGYITQGTLSQLTASSPWLASAGYKAIVGFWCPLTGSPGIEEYTENLSPTAFINFLDQNNPNPARDHTTVQYSIAQEGRVKLDVYNTLGQCIESLVDQKQSPGVYKVTWNIFMDNLPAGVYFYRLKTADYTKIKKMVVIH
jgi:hypothetical protein